MSSEYKKVKVGISPILIYKSRNKEENVERGERDRFIEKEREVIIGF